VKYFVVFYRTDPFDDEISLSQTPSLLTSLPPDDVMDLEDEKYGK